MKISNSDASAHHSFRVDEADANNHGAMTAYSDPSILTQMGWDEIHIFNMDIEGAEEGLFTSGYASWLGKVGILKIEVHDSAERQASRALFRALESENINYRLRPQGENLVIKKITSV